MLALAPVQPPVRLDFLSLRWTPYPYPSVANVGVQDGKIAVITGDAITGRDTVDATGDMVASGFIDIHSHGQLAFLVHQPATNSTETCSRRSTCARAAPATRSAVRCPSARSSASGSMRRAAKR